MNDLLPELRARLDRFVREKPQAQPLVDRLLQRRAEATTDEQREKLDRLLWSVVKPKRLNVWLAVGLPALMLGVLLLFFVSERRHAAAVRAGVRTTAEVVRQDEGWCWLGSKGSTCLRLALRIHPPGAAPYDAVLEGSIQNRFLPRVQPGSWLTVSVSREDRTEALFDEEAMAVASPPPVTSAR